MCTGCWLVLLIGRCTLSYQMSKFEWIFLQPFILANLKQSSNDTLRYQDWITTDSPLFTLFWCKFTLTDLFTVKSHLFNLHSALIVFPLHSQSIKDTLTLTWGLKHVWPGWGLSHLCSEEQGLVYYDVIMMSCDVVRVCDNQKAYSFLPQFIFVP